MPQRLDYPKFSGPSYQALLALDKSVVQAGLDPAMRHLAKIRASQLNGCLFCLDLHTKEALRDGEQILRLVHLPAWRESTLFNATERAALDWTERLTRLDGQGIPEEAVEAARQALGDQGLADLSFAVVVINAWNRLGAAFTPVPGSLDKAFGLDRVALAQ